MGTGIKLTAERLRRDWTQCQIAKEMGISPQVVCDWEKGRSFPSYKTLIKVEDLFNMNHRELFAPASDENPFSSTD